MKLTLNDVTNIDALSVINDNFDKIEQELQNKVLYRNNPSGEPNSISNDIDMNGNDLLNVGDVVSVNGRWATIDEVEGIKDQVEDDAATVAADKAIVLGYRNTAQTAATDAQAAYDTFDDRYLGVKSSDPGLDNDGNTLVAGALYFRSGGAPIMRVYNGTTWQDVGSITTTTTNLIDPTLYASQTEAEEGVNNTKVITPLSAKQAINKQVKEGFTSSGAIVLPGNATNALEAVPKQQMDAAIPSIASSATTQSGVSTTQTVSPKGLADSVLAGKTQTWQSVTGSRSLGVTYTNSTGAPILVMVYLLGAGAGGPTAIGYVDGELRFQDARDAAGPGVATTVILFVQPGSTYSVTGLNYTLTRWSELRA